ncbi:hypothetical protein [Streptomyces sp. CNQ085]|uniref:DUF7848 domain-containing protein n=1 Tax=Streptomyces sp. CNQ085 TaxID=2886944 RepID=UPI001F50BA47|nr:hypothetical protein [Streptomyces sp. CNQ085]MCI0386228.1 hypothetical protein [Streptomyces sp. CNQ085]
MSTRSVIRLASRTLEPGAEPGAEPVTYAMECAVCGRRPGADVGCQDVQRWALAHADRAPSRHTCREIIHRPRRAWTRG